MQDKLKNTEYHSDNYENPLFVMVDPYLRWMSRRDYMQLILHVGNEKFKSLAKARVSD